MDSAEGVADGVPAVARTLRGEVTVHIREDLATHGTLIACHAYGQLLAAGWEDTAHVLRRDVLGNGDDAPDAGYVLEWLRQHEIGVTWTPKS